MNERGLILVTTLAVITIMFILAAAAANMGQGSATQTHYAADVNLRLNNKIRMANIEVYERIRRRIGAANSAPGSFNYGIAANHPPAVYIDFDTNPPTESASYFAAADAMFDIGPRGANGLRPVSITAYTND